MTVIRTAIFGCGAVTNVLYIPALQEVRDELELVGVADLNLENAKSLLKEFPGARSFTNYDELLAELRPDAVIVALPHCLHKSASVDAMRMGANVFCEKPMAVDSHECDEIELAANETGRVFAVNLLRRQFPSVRAIKRLVESQALGAPRAFEITEGAPYQWPAMSFSVFDRKISGGGVLIDSGVHLLDLLQWWLGQIGVVEFLDDAELNGVECDCVATVTAGKARGSLRMSRSVALPNVYRLEFDRGWIEWDHDDGSRFRFSSGGQEVVGAEVQCDERWASGSRFIYALTKQLRNFVR
ncbi:MAG: Gfo/Idh/MocA family oxidoreductase, partial [Candidatus Acidiferrales bacterium]